MVKEKVLLRDLPGRKDLIGKRINVQRQGGKYHYDYQDQPRIRVFLGAKLYYEKDRKTGERHPWIRWDWVPEQREGSTALECGFSGVGMGELFGDSYFLIGEG